VFGKKQEYQQLQQLICAKFNLEPSDSFLLGLTKDKQWNRFKRENGINRVCLTPAYEKVKHD